MPRKQLQIPNWIGKIPGDMKVGEFAILHVGRYLDEITCTDSDGA